LDREGRERVLRELLAARILKVYLTGGEPLVLPDVWDLLDGLLGAGVFVELTTNGTHLTPGVCEKLRGLGLSSLQVSLNGAEEASNARVMGGGWFAAILKGVDHALEAGLSVHVRPTVLAENIARLPALIELLARRGVAQIDLREVTPLGRAAAGFGSRQPSPESLRALEEFCRKWSKPGTRVAFESWSLAFHKQMHPAGCTLGAPHPGTVLIDEAGHLAGCSASFYLGFTNSVLEYGFLGAWQRLELLAQFRDPARLGGECASCELLETCRGGCRAAAARLSGELQAPDPLCPRVEGDFPEKLPDSSALWKLA
jgi:pyrroloquinoline quinone biosynthesis protein E